MSDAQAATHDDFFDSLLGDFLDESGQLLDNLNENLLTLDEWVHSLVEGEVSRCDEELMNEMFRSAHSLKGLSGMLGLTAINNLTHNVENVFDAARRDELQLSTDHVEMIFQSVDLLLGMVDCLKDPSLPEVESGAVVARIQGLLQDAGVAKAQQTQAEADLALTVDDVDEAAPSIDVPSETNETAETEVIGELDDTQYEEPAAAASAPVVSEIVDSEAAVSEVTVSEVVVSEVSVSEVSVSEVSVSEVSVSEVSVSEVSVSEVSVSEVVVSTPAIAESAMVDLFAGIEDETEVPSKYLAIFIDESELALDALTETLLVEEGGGDGKDVENLLMVAHRFKGSAASIGLNRTAKLAHHMEDILQERREQKKPLTPELTDAILNCNDALRSYLEQLKSGEPNTDSFNALVHELLAAQKTVTEPPAPAVAPAEIPAGDSSETEVAADNTPCESLSKEDLRRLVDSAPTGTLGYIGRVHFQPDFPLVGLKAQLIHEKLCQLGSVFHCEPSAESLENLEELAQLTFGISTERDDKEITRQLHIGAVQEVQLERFGWSTEATPQDEPAPAAVEATPARAEPAVAPPPAAKVAAPVAAAAAAPSTGAIAPPSRAAAKPRTQESSKPAETLRVDIERLDQLMNLAGQLVINKARFTRIGDGLKQVLSGKHSPQNLKNSFGVLSKIMSEVDGCDDSRTRPASMESIRSHTRRLQADLEGVLRDMETISEARSGITDLFDAVHQLDRVSNGIQKSVMDTRMVPVGPLFNRFKRVIRDITRGNGKDIRLIIRGEKTELDKRMIDELGDPLIHMVRNSADHGVEPPEVREAAGKPRQGEVTLDAFHRGNSIVIQVIDDGKGLAPEVIRNKAIEKGIVSEADAEKLTTHQTYQLIWEPGFSTAEKVTEISGRGMGMDIVRSKIEELSGQVELDSTPGVGTTFTIKLPLTLAILPSLMAKIDHDVFALPIESVVEIMSVPASDFSTVHGLRTANVRGRVISVVGLNDVFSWNREPNCRENTVAKTSDETLVILSSEGSELGLCVDELLGEEDVVIKSMAENYRNVEGIAGASILGDGSVALILDIGTLIQMASRQTGESATPQEVLV